MGCITCTSIPNFRPKGDKNHNPLNVEHTLIDEIGELFHPPPNVPPMPNFPQVRTVRRNANYRFLLTELRSILQAC